MSEQKRTPSMQRVMDASTGLRRMMKTRDAIMVVVGGTLGTGIFLSTGDVLTNADPGFAICRISVRWIYHLVDDSLSWRTVSGDLDNLLHPIKSRYSSK